MNIFNKILNILKGIYVTNRLYYLGTVLVLVFIAGHFIPVFYIIAKASFLLLMVSLFLNIFILFESENPVKAERHKARRLSNGDRNRILISVSNNYKFEIQIRIIDEIPHQFQIRDFEIRTSLKAVEEKM